MILRGFTDWRNAYHAHCRDAQATILAARHCDHSRFKRAIKVWKQCVLRAIQLKKASMSVQASVSKKTGARVFRIWHDKRMKRGQLNQSYEFLAKRSRQLGKGGNGELIDFDEHIVMATFHAINAKQGTVHVLYACLFLLLLVLKTRRGSNQLKGKCLLGWRELSIHTQACSLFYHMAHQAHSRRIFQRVFARWRSKTAPTREKLSTAIQNRLRRMCTRWSAIAQLKQVQSTIQIQGRRNLLRRLWSRTLEEYQERIQIQTLKFHMKMEWYVVLVYA